MLGRTMHGIDYDDLHDEIVVPQQFGQAILVFKGSARGEEPPIRVIQGSKTMLTAMDRLAVDPYNDEIYVPEGDRVLVFDRTAQRQRRAEARARPRPWLYGGRLGRHRPHAQPPRRRRDRCETRATAEPRSSPSSTAPRQGNASPKRVISGLKARLMDPGNMRVHPEGGLHLRRPAGRLRRRLEHRRQRRGAAAVHGRRPQGHAEETARPRHRPRAQRRDRVGQGTECGADLRDAADLQADINRERRTLTGNRKSEIGNRTDLRSSISDFRFRFYAVGSSAPFFNSRSIERARRARMAEPRKRSRALRQASRTPARAAASGTGTGSGPR